MAAVNLRLDTALASMSQGLCLFDADGRLVVVNARYAELFGLPEGAARPGMTLKELIELRIGRDNHGNVTSASLLSRKMAAIQSRTPTSFNMTLADGRVLAVVLRPAPNGCPTAPSSPNASTAPSRTPRPSARPRSSSSISTASRPSTTRLATPPATCS
jgi:PAS domain-containing protein